MEITAEQYRDLEAIAKRGEPAYMRTKALGLLSLADGRRVAEVAAIFRVSRQTVYEWRRRFLDGGIDALKVQPGRGRKAQADLEEVKSYVRQSPRNFGIARTRWTLETLAQAVPSLQGFTPRGVQAVLERADIHYKLGQPWLHSPDPDYDKKKRQ